ncbi:MAG: alpha,alpha-trehalase [Saprospiraceae bacterium]|jgi:alpha,alpha-trehalase
MTSKKIGKRTRPIPLEDHLKSLWSRLERLQDKSSKRSSKISLPFPYVIPGGRFNEIYYRDSYFTMLGLIESDRIDLVESMVQNFRYLIDTFGHFPNGNRSYFLSRSQPPFYSLMVKLLIHHKAPAVISHYMSSLIKEYNFWMNGIDKLENENLPENRVVKINGSFLLNRYYDSKDTPREEMYGDDWEMIDFSDSKSNPLFRNLRGACESGWDFSSRWLSDIHNLRSARTLELLPIDLNCLLWHMEQLISECYDHLDKGELSLQYGIIANNR